MMEVYVQECMAPQYMAKLSQETRGNIVELAGAFQMTFENASKLRHAKIPEHIWFILFSR